jgi:hypothetical protein
VASKRIAVFDRVGAREITATGWNADQDESKEEEKVAKPGKTRSMFAWGI